MTDTPHSLSEQEIAHFHAFVRNFYERYGRHGLPWRQPETTPYQILVSEIMLQQTQVERVIPKFKAFIASFPDIEALANASQAEVLKYWQGLGYNRRGLNLHKAAQKIVADFQSQVPRSIDQLILLPGIGPYTAAAVSAFAFNQPETVVETNIRAVYIYHFFPDQKEKISDELLIPYIQKTLPAKNPRAWYSALMDYGTHLKKVLPNPSRKSKHTTKQSTFSGSLRQVRGQILKILLETSPLTAQDIKSKVTGNHDHFQAALQQLSDEGFITNTKNSYHLVQ